MPGVGAGRGEGPDHGAVHRGQGRRAGGRQQVGGESGGEGAGHVRGPRATRNLAGRADRWQGAAQAVRRTARVVGKATCSTKAASWRKVRTSYTPSQTAR